MTPPVVGRFDWPASLLATVTEDVVKETPGERTRSLRIRYQVVCRWDEKRQMFRVGHQGISIDGAGPLDATTAQGALAVKLALPDMLVSRDGSFRSLGNAQEIVTASIEGGAPPQLAALLLSMIEKKSRDRWGAWVENWTDLDVGPGELKGR